MGFGYIVSCHDFPANFSLSSCWTVLMGRAIRMELLATSNYSKRH